MQKYTCIRCLKVFPTKYKIKRHLNGTRPCKIKNTDVSRESLLGLLETDEYASISESYSQNNICSAKIHQNSTKIHQNPAKIHQNPAKNPPKFRQNSTKNDENSTKNDENSTKNNSYYTQKSMILLENSLECEHCHKKFSRKDAKLRHIQKNRCVVLKKQFELAKIDESKKIINSNVNSNNTNNTNNITNNTTNMNNSHNTNNTQNIININCYGKEDISYITNELLEKVVNNPGYGIPRLVELIHFNPEHPENNNVKLINKKEPYLDFFNGESWTTADKSKVIGNLLMSKKELTDNYMDYFEGDEEKKKNFAEYEKYSTAIEFFVNNFVFDDPLMKPSKRLMKKIYKHLEKDLYAMILNHRKHIKDLYVNDEL